MVSVPFSPFVVTLDDTTKQLRLRGCLEIRAAWVIVKDIHSEANTSLALLLMFRLIGKFMLFLTTMVRTKRTMTGWPPIPMCTFTLRPLQRVG